MLPAEHRWSELQHRRGRAWHKPFPCSGFVLDGNKIRGLEQNPDTKSRWALMARAGKKVMQFLSEGRYVANVADGEGDLLRQAGQNESVEFLTAPFF